MSKQTIQRYQLPAEGSKRLLTYFSESIFTQSKRLKKPSSKLVSIQTSRRFPSPKRRFFQEALRVCAARVARSLPASATSVSCAFAEARSSIRRFAGGLKIESPTQGLKYQGLGPQKTSKEPPPWVSFWPSPFFLGGKEQKN